MHSFVGFAGTSRDVSKRLDYMSKYYVLILCDNISIDIPQVSIVSLAHIPPSSRQVLVTTLT